LAGHHRRGACRVDAIGRRPYPGSPDDTIFVGTGSAAKPHEGGYEAFGPNGTLKWSVSVHNPGATYVSAVVASLAVGDLQGGLDVVGPSVGQNQDAINAITGTVLPGFPWFQGDGDYATPALADLYGTGKLEIVNGGGQTAGLAYNTHYIQGGHVRVLSRTGNEGYRQPNGGLICEYKPDESVESSPAVGPFLADGKEGIAVGTGNYQHGGGSVYALNGATGAVMWRQSALGAVIGGVVTADLGSGYQDVIVASTGGAQVLDGKTGAVLAILERGVGLQNCALVTADPNGSIGVTLAGYGPTDGGVVQHYELVGSSGAVVAEAGAWPMFHHDPYLSGNAQEKSPRG
jgi:outer membrane protein assembly factor BamB